MQWMVIYAPQGAGKSLLASAIARHFGLVRVLDGECWRPEEGVPAGTLVLTNLPDVPGAVPLEAALKDVVGQAA